MLLEDPSTVAISPLAKVIHADFKAKYAFEAKGETKCVGLHDLLKEYNRRLEID